MGKIYINKESNVLKTGQSVYIPSNACRMIKNIGKDDLKFLCIVSPPWRGEDESICK
jgi:mannose-6-phosphate isomerase-like protein (cupin superfamily)